MPQLDFEFWPPQIFWLALTFTALYMLMSRVALPRIATVLEHRRDRIASDLEGAQHLKLEMEGAIAAYDSALTEARAKARAILTESRAILQTELDADRTRVEAEISERIIKADHQINEMKLAAMKEIDLAATDTAKIIVKTLIGAAKKTNPSKTLPTNQQN